MILKCEAAPGTHAPRTVRLQLSAFETARTCQRVWHGV